MLLIYYDHECNGKKCFRINCPDPQYTNCLHPAMKSIVKGKLVSVHNVLHDDCSHVSIRKIRY